MMMMMMMRVLVLVPVPVPVPVPVWNLRPPEHLLRSSLISFPNAFRLRAMVVHL